MNLPPLQYAIAMLRPAAATAEQLSARLKENPDSVRNAAKQLCSLGILSSVTTAHVHYSLSAEGQKAASNGLPESQLATFLADGPKPPSALPPELARFGLANAKKAGIVAFEGGMAALTLSGRELLSAGSLPSIPNSESALFGLAPETLVAYEKRGLLLRSEKTDVNFTASSECERLLDAGELHLEEEGTGTLTREMLLSGGWQNLKFREYDVAAPAVQSFPSRRHPISTLREKIRGIFTRMGFTEMGGPHVESAFWNFDALFQPQGHPARDLADTFYVKGKSKFPSHSLVERVRHAHNAGWKYCWEEWPAKKVLLRTHTTAVSARTLARLAQESSSGRKKATRAGGRFFSVGKVFRNEATDYKHLAEFFQVEGIISYEGATFRDLLGTLREFYLQLGFSKIRFRPSFFPYTEPSLEIEVFYEPRKAWLELGGAGMLRPEVCAPLGAQYPTLAWGLSLERPLMISNKIDDIRAFYRNELGWLRNFPIQ